MRLVIASVLAIVSSTGTASAQDMATPAQRALTVSAGVMDFDLSGTGQAFVGTARVSWPLTGTIAVEAGSSFATPEQDFGPSTLFAPEVHLQYHWRVGRVRPFAGGGIGFAYITSDAARNDTDLTLSAAGGVRVDVTSRLAAFGEMRVRGIEHDFVGSIAEWTGGLTWRLGQ